MDHTGLSRHSQSGHHITSVTTLERLAAAFDVELLVGFETEAATVSSSLSSDQPSASVRCRR